MYACLFVLGKFKEDYWLVCEPMRNKEKIGGKSSAASLYRVYTNRGDSRAGILARGNKHRHCSRYWQVTTGNEIFSQTSALQSGHQGECVN